MRPSPGLRCRCGFAGRGGLVCFSFSVGAQVVPSINFPQLGEDVRICHEGKWSCNDWMHFPTLLLTLLLLCQVSPVSGKGPSVDNRPPATAELKLAKTAFERSRAGYVGLEWNTLKAAAEYVVTDQRGQAVYRGTVPIAFVSGLPDGQHTFWVSATDADGEVLAVATEPAILNVQHWPLSLALSLFGVGLLAFLTLVAILFFGARQATQRDRQLAASDAAAG